jgi:predicted negative regulator of RcsB-dependent stress response
MATLDLQEQEQLENLKAFWAKWGALISSLVTLILLAFAGWNGWNWYQRDQGLKASVLFESIEQAVEAPDLDKAQRLVGEMQTRFAGAAYTAQATLLVAQAVPADKALPLLQWAATQGKPADLSDLAKLRLAGLHLEAKRLPETLVALDGIKSPAFAALIADRRGDVATLQKDVAKAREQYSLAYQSMEPELPYRRLVEAKLMSVGVDPASLAKKAEAP